MSKPDAGAKRTRLSPDERRQQLITLGARMLRERPLEDVSVSDIAEQAGISHGLLFHYFPTLQDFHLAIIAYANAELLARTTPNPALPLPDMLRDSIQRYVDYVDENRTSYMALLRGPVSASPELVAMVNAHRLAQVQRILAESPIPVTDSGMPRLTLAVRGWIAFVEETTLTWLREAPIPREALIDLLVDSLPALALNSTLADALRD
ncbi:TetR family transcriptional regulator [Nocardia sp. SYP-A9097]|uniref:TetR/AcrR family transcriptional regulator n=1 Tax=Nocardia sp. SYP-A9097 TaxID=2663237 RepID=UPI00132622D2|nr:TetR/AcrR family transcriptional regulator [Nocardia sp. SYP-A9097]MRH91142.1 TetR family transcriptional regulator [Nocardia sp. SYP-A9097]